MVKHFSACASRCQASCHDKRYPAMVKRPLPRCDSMVSTACSPTAWISTHGAFDELHRNKKDHQALFSRLRHSVFQNRATRRACVFASRQGRAFCYINTRKLTASSCLAAQKDLKRCEKGQTGDGDKDMFAVIRSLQCGPVEGQG